ncbi:hypothetical protein PUN28_013725 [Cardiocondyla obscurior]|uniref:Uncharacterized protein n=1 Tax=Cardiocondyla obscurior TaxID=286306 RepID=A0AAW2F4B7_9HYME
MRPSVAGPRLLPDRPRRHSKPVPQRFHSRWLTRKYCDANDNITATQGRGFSDSSYDFLPLTERSHYAHTNDTDEKKRKKKK